MKHSKNSIPKTYYRLRYEDFCWKSDRYSTIDAALTDARTKRNLGDGHDDYWNSIPITIEKVTVDDFIVINPEDKK
jgi:hypothetical protein